MSVSDQSLMSRSAELSRLTRTFSDAVSIEIGEATAAVVRNIGSRLKIRDGVIVHSYDNAVQLSNAASVISAALDSTRYKPTLLAATTLFPDQVDSLLNLYDEMRRLSVGGFMLPEDVSLSDLDVESLANRAAGAYAALDMVTKKVTQEVAKMVNASLGTESSHLSQGVSEGMRKMSSVVPIFKDQVMTFFRFASSLIYSKIESTGLKLRYSYVGDVGEHTRSFCKKRVGLVFSRREIAAMRNGQLPNALMTGGGHGCEHWWSIAEVIP